MTTSGEAFAVAALQAAVAQWRVAGGHILTRAGAPAALCAASLQAFCLQQAAGALDAEAESLQLALRELNGTVSGDGAVSRGPRPCEAPPGADDTSDGSPVQADLVRRNVQRGKPEICVSPPARPAVAPSGDGGGPEAAPEGCVRAPDGSFRILWSGLLSPSECQMLVAAGVAMMASAFSRYGQCTLGLSPALAQRTAATEELAPALPLLYTAVERARRRVAATRGKPLHQWRVSDATLTRLRPAPLPGDADAGGAGAASGAAPAASAPQRLACEAGSLDVGFCRGDRFCYWRPHLDQVSVTEYEQSALLYLTSHTADFEGGRLLFYDDATDSVVLPEGGLLVSFASGAPNLHAVERVESGARFALTMWFTTQPADPCSSLDETHAAMLEWAQAAVAAEERAEPPPPPPLLSQRSADGLPSRDEALASSALCSLPPNDPLCEALLTARPGRSLSAVMRASLGLKCRNEARGRLGCATTNPLARAPADADDAALDLPSLLERLHSRVRLYDALCDTLARASAGRTAEGDAGPRAAGAGGASGLASAAPPHTPPASAGVADPFDVFG